MRPAALEHQSPTTVSRGRASSPFARASRARSVRTTGLGEEGSGACLRDGGMCCCFPLGRPASRRGPSQRGNVRELCTILASACLTWIGGRIDQRDVQDALHSMPSSGASGPAERDLDDAFSVQELAREPRSSYVRRALKESRGVKSRAAEPLGVPLLTLSHWMKEPGLGA